MPANKTIQKLRQQAGLTQYELAEKLFVSRDLVSKWETGGRRPDYGNVVRMAEIFGVSTDEIVNPDELLLEELSECIPAECEAGSERLSAVINGFLRSLPEKECSVFVRRYYLMEEPADIGTFFGIKTGNVYLTLHRVRKKLKQYLSEELK